MTRKQKTSSSRCADIHVYDRQGHKIAIKNIRVDGRQTTARELRDMVRNNSEDTKVTVVTEHGLVSTSLASDRLLGRKGRRNFQPDNRTVHLGLRAENLRNVCAAEGSTNRQRVEAFRAVLNYYPAGMPVGDKVGASAALRDAISVRPELAGELVRTLEDFHSLSEFLSTGYMGDVRQDYLVSRVFVDGVMLEGPAVPDARQRGEAKPQPAAALRTLLHASRALDNADRRVAFSALQAFTPTTDWAEVLGDRTPSEAPTRQEALQLLETAPEEFLASIATKSADPAIWAELSRSLWNDPQRSERFIRSAALDILNPETGPRMYDPDVEDQVTELLVGRAASTNEATARLLRYGDVSWWREHMLGVDSSTPINADAAAETLRAVISAGILPDWSTAVADDDTGSGHAEAFRDLYQRIRLGRVEPDAFSRSDAKVFFASTKLYDTALPVCGVTPEEMSEPLLDRLVNHPETAAHLADALTLLGSTGEFNRRISSAHDVIDTLIDRKPLPVVDGVPFGAVINGRDVDGSVAAIAAQANATNKIRQVIGIEVTNPKSRTALEQIGMLVNIDEQHNIVGSPTATPPDLRDYDAVFSSPAELIDSFVTYSIEALAAINGAAARKDFELEETDAIFDLRQALDFHSTAFDIDQNLGPICHDLSNWLFAGVAGPALLLADKSDTAEKYARHQKSLLSGVTRVGERIRELGRTFGSGAPDATPRAAAEVALGYPLLENIVTGDGTPPLLVTDREDADSVAAGAVIVARAVRGTDELPLPMRNRVLRVAAFDSGKEWASAEWRPNINRDKNPENNTTGTFSAYNQMCHDRTLTYQEKILLGADWLETGTFEGAERYQEIYTDRRRRLVDEMSSARSQGRFRAENGVASVVTEHPGAVFNEIYNEAPLGVVTNPHMPGRDGSPSYVKHTVGRFNERSVPGNWDALKDALNQAELARGGEAGWGGAASILGSPQNVDSKLSSDDVRAIVETWLTSGRSDT